MSFTPRPCAPAGPITVVLAFGRITGPTYYAAFVIDPDGHPLEAVSRKAPQQQQPIIAIA
jgi:hypothetical protein